MAQKTSLLMLGKVHGNVSFKACRLQGTLLLLTFCTIFDQSYF